MQIEAKYIDNLQEQIKTRVKDKELTIAELERQSGLKVGAVLNIMNGRSANPGIEFVAAIAKTLNCSVDELIKSTTSASRLQQTTELNEDTHNNKPVAWNAELYKDCTNKVEDYLKSKNLKPDSMPDSEKILIFIRDAYLYALEGDETKADPRFIKWLIDKSLKK